MSNIIEFRGVSKQFDDILVLDNIDLQVREGEFLTLLGPSGCGKTTLLRLISGFEQPDSGNVIIAGRDVTKLPPQQRHVHTVFQSFALFPHLSVFDNVAFGLRCNKQAEDSIKQQVMDVLQLVRLSHLANRKPKQLSGGQQQRVAIARAMVNKPLVLLLDEPLSALDYQLRKSMQIELMQLHRKLKLTFILVTHDQEEALSMSDRIVVMQDGVIQQIGTPREVYEEPNNLRAARFIGELNIIDVTVEQATADHIEVNIEGVSCALRNSKNFNQDDLVHILIRPEDLRVWHPNEISDTSNMFYATVEEVIYKGSTVDLRVRLASGQLLAATEFFDEDDEELEYSIGDQVWVNWFPGWEVILPYDA